MKFWEEIIIFLQGIWIISVDSLVNLISCNDSDTSFPYVIPHHYFSVKQCFWNELKADRPHPHDYPQTPTDYTHRSYVRHGILVLEDRGQQFSCPHAVLVLVVLVLMNSKSSHPRPRGHWAVLVPMSVVRQTGQVWVRWRTDGQTDVTNRIMETRNYPTPSTSILHGIEVLHVCNSPP